jgi:SAM-dependent methyltransferase
MIPAEHDAMLAHDEHHWWYCGRRRVLQAAIGRLTLPTEPRVLDAGCGSGRTLDDLSRLGPVAGLDLSPQSVAAAWARGHADVHVGPVEAIDRPDGSFDLVTCLDVIEHTADDVATLRELRRVTRPGGHVLVTVPAHPALWSTHDEVNQHFRRYTRRALHAAAAQAGLRLCSDTYFNGLLLAPAAAVRWTRRLHPAGEARSDLALTPAILDGPLQWPMMAEARIIAAGGRIPFGLSLLAVLEAPVVAPRRRRSVLTARSAVPA